MCVWVCGGGVESKLKQTRGRWMIKRVVYIIQKKAISPLAVWWDYFCGKSEA